MLDEPRTKIVKTFAGWTALSALRSGSPVKSRKLIYSLLRCVRFAELFSPADTRMLERDFGRWHREAVESLAARGAVARGRLGSKDRERVPEYGGLRGRVGKAWTWNGKHIANAAMRHAIESVCRSAGYEPPVICPPEELMSHEED